MSALSAETALLADELNAASSMSGLDEVVLASENHVPKDFSDIWSLPVEF